MAEQIHRIFTDAFDWEIILLDGSRLVVTADGYAEKDGDIVFSWLADGAPNYEVDVLRLPRNVVDSILTID